MAMITFDTLKFVEKLKAEALQEAIGTAEIATKRDVERLESKMENRFERVDGKLTLVQWIQALDVTGEAVPVLAKLFQ